MFNRIQTEIYQSRHTDPLCLYTGIKNIWHYYYKLKLSAFMASQSGLILVLSTYSAWGLFTTCSVVVCSVPINVLQTTTESKQNQTHPCQTTQQTHCAPSSSGLAFLPWYSTKGLLLLLLTWAPQNASYSLLFMSHLWRVWASAIITRPVLLSNPLIPKRGDGTLQTQSNRTVSILVPHTNRILSNSFWKPSLIEVHQRLTLFPNPISILREIKFLEGN